MSGKIEKYDIVTEEALRTVQQLLSEIKKVTTELNNLKKSTNSIKDLGGAAESNKKLSDSTQKLTEKEKELAKILKQIERLNARQTSEYKKLNAEKQRLSAQQTKENAAIRRQVTGTKSLTTSLKNLLGSLKGVVLAYIGFNQVLNLGRNIFKTTKQLDSLDFAIRKVITNELELASTNNFLIKITKAYGAELISTTNRYIKFAAAAKQSNVSINDTQKIFESVTKAAGVLGLRTDELTGVYLALEQMLSKGKVTTEELRRQLGERIPGAFGIMADAIGVSISELDKMLKKGEVLSGEVLPKFAIQLEKAFGIENVNKVETLVAAQARLTIEWQEFVKEMKASPVIAKGLDLIANSIGKIRREMSGENTLIDAETNDLLSEAFKRISDAVTVEEKRAEIIKIIGELQKQQLGGSIALKKSEEERERISKGLADQFFRFATAGVLSGENLEKINRALFNMDTPRLNLDETIKGFGITDVAITKTIEKLKEYFKTIKTPPFNPQEPIGITQDAIDMEIDGIEEIEGGYDAALDTIEAYWMKRIRLANDNELEVINIQRERIFAALNADKIYHNLSETQKQEYYNRLKQLDKDYFEYESNEEISRLYAIQDEKTIARSKEFSQQISELKRNSAKRIAVEAKYAVDLLTLEYKTQKAIYDSDLTLKDEKAKALEKMAQLEIALNEKVGESNSKLNEKKREELAQLLNYTQDVLSAGADFNAAINERNLQNAQRRYELETALAGDNKFEQIQAEKKYQKETAKLKRRQAIADKAAAAFDIIINTAVAISKLEAQTALLGIPLIPIIAGIGALQLAAVLAQPIPKFEKGGITKTPTIMAGEKGTEMGITPSGNVFLTPDKASVLNNIPIGTEIIPHDETARILANQAYNQSFDKIDMSRTNGHLTKIEKNTAERSYVDNGYRYVERPGFKGRYKI